MNNNKIIKTLYNTIIQERTEEDEITRDMKDEILDLLKEEDCRLSQQEYGQYRDKVFQAAFIAEESGFVRGFKFAFRLFSECMQD